MLDIGSSAHRRGVGGLGRAQQAGTGLCVMGRGHAGQPFQGSGHDVGPAGLVGQGEGVAEVLRRSAGVAEVVVGIAKAAAGGGEADLRAQLLGRPGQPKNRCK
jgi:hypothetical protein